MPASSHALLTVDLGFGDAGKGSVVDYLVRATGAHTVVRYNGGAQAGHRVVTAETPPREHVFSQFGSGTLAGAGTHLGRWMLLEPLAMENEAAHLRALGVTDLWERVTIDERALVITPFQRAVNRLRELARGEGRHGSCGLGVGETMRDFVEHGPAVLRAGDLRDPDRLAQGLAFLLKLNRAKLAPLRATLPESAAVAEEVAWLDDPDALPWLMEHYRGWAARLRIVPPSFLATLLKRPGTTVFEGAQGVLLDEWSGFHPYTTWSTTTLARAEGALEEAAFPGTITRLGITRAYATRHGPGPFPTEAPALTAALPDPANHFDPWQRAFRVGWLDLPLLRYAIEAAGPLDGLAVTCLDRLDALAELQLCTGYQLDGQPVSELTHSPRPRALSYQEGLTRTLFRAAPCLLPLADRDALLDHLQRALGLPILLRSYGPTAADKRALWDGAVEPDQPRGDPTRAPTLKSVVRRSPHPRFQ